MSDSLQYHRRQPTRLPRPWDSPGKNTGVGCHFLLQCVKVKSGSEVTQSCPTLRDPMDCTLPGSSDHGIFQARVLEWFPLLNAEVKSKSTQDQEIKQSSVLMLYFFLSLCWTCYNIASVCFGVFFWPQGMWDLSSPTRNQTYIPCIQRQSLNYWTARQVSILLKNITKISLY